MKMKAKIIADSKNKYGYIYKITNLVSNKCYVGQRKCTHNLKDDIYFGSGKILKYSIKKHGKENFAKEILEYCENEKILDEREAFNIKTHNTLYPNGYNISENAKGGAYLNNHPDKEIIKKKISDALKGYIWSEERNKKVSVSLKGHKVSDETKEKISKTKLQTINLTSWNKGITANKIQCKYCLRDISYNLINRFHNNNCKLKSNETIS